MSFTSPGFVQIPAGYHKCATCGHLVPDGSTHYCQPQTYTYTYGGNWVDQETKDLLKRIAEALEKIANK